MIGVAVSGKTNLQSIDDFNLTRLKDFSLAREEEKKRREKRKREKNSQKKKGNKLETFSS